MTSKRQLEDALHLSSTAAAPTPDDAFVEGLERRLLASGAGNVVPFARRVRRIGVATTALIAFSVAGAAATAGVVITRPFSNDVSASRPSTTLTPSITDAARTTTVASATTFVTIVVTVNSAASTIAPTTTLEAETTPATVATGTIVTPTATVATSVVDSIPTVAPATTPATTQPSSAQPSSTTTTPAPQTTVAPTTTEARTPAILTLTCAPDGTTVQCNWSATPVGTVRMAVLRSVAGGTGPGRVFFVDVSLNVWSDPMPVSGIGYVYLVHAFDGNDHSLGHSNAVTINCC